MVTGQLTVPCDSVIYIQSKNVFYSKHGNTQHGCYTAIYCDSYAATYCFYLLERFYFRKSGELLNRHFTFLNLYQQF